MKKQQNLLGLILASLTGVALLALLVTHALLPHIILPRMSFSTIVLLSLASLVLDHYISRQKKHDFRLIPLFGALIFGLFPLAAFTVTPIEAIKSAVIGAIVLTVLTYLYDTIIDRLSDTPTAKISPVISAFGLYLAAQCLIGII